jgi:hypothetical protein
MLQELVKNEIVQVLLEHDCLAFQRYHDPKYTHIVRYMQYFGKGFFIKRDGKQERSKEYMDKRAILEAEYEASAVVPIKVFEDEF